MIQVRQVIYWCVLTSLMSVQAGGFVQAGIVYDTPSSVYQQNFNSLPSTPLGSTATWANDSTLVGWHGFTGASGTAGSVFILPYNGGSGTFIGGLHSLGTTAADRALGTTTALATNLAMAVSFTNNAGISLDNFTVKYDGEQWRRGNNANAESLVFAYGFGSSYANVTLWSNASSLNFTTPIVGVGTAVGLDGNLPANRVANITSTISGVDWKNGDTLWLRWSDTVVAGEDHTMSLDDFSFTASTTVVPEPSSIVLLGIAAVAGAGRLARRTKRKRARLSNSDS